MHIPDGMVHGPVALGTGVLSVGLVGYAVSVTKRRWRERQIPLVGVTAAIVFLVQLISVPVGLGTSVHVLGAALAGIMLGAWTGALVVSVAVLLFTGMGSGGVTTLGANLWWAVLATVGATYLFRVLARLLPRTRRGVLAASAVAGWVSAILAGGTVAAIITFGGPFADAAAGVFAVMIGVQALVGVAEAALTAVVLGAVLTARPDLLANADVLPLS